MLDDATPAAPTPAGGSGSVPSGTEETLTVSYHHVRTGEVVELTATFHGWQRVGAGPRRTEPGATLRHVDGETGTAQTRIVPWTLLTEASRRLLGEPDIPMKPPRRPGRRRRQAGRSPSPSSSPRHHP